MGSEAPVVDRRERMGTRAGLHGQTLVSTGHGTLDALLGGGLPRGAIMVVDSTHQKGAPHALMRLFLAEGVACGHSCAWFTARKDAMQTTTTLPALAKKETAARSEQELNGGKDKVESLRIAWQYRRYLRSEEDSQAATEGGANKVKTKPRRTGGRSGHEAALKGAAREWCHRFDLRKRMDEEAIQTNGGKLEVYHMEALSGIQGVLETCREFAHKRVEVATEPLNHHQIFEWNHERRRDQQDCTQRTSISADAADTDVPSAKTSFKRFGKMSLADAFVKKKVASQSNAERTPLVKDNHCSEGTPSGPERVMAPSDVKRIVLEGLGSHEWTLLFGDNEERKEEENMLDAMLTLRHIAQVTNCTIYVAASLGLCSDNFSMKVRHFADAVVALDPLTGDKGFYKSLPDPTSCTNLLRVIKLPIMGSLGPVAAPPIGQTYLVRNKRHKIIVEELSLPPEDAQTTENKDQGVAQLLCGGPAASPSTLEF